MDTATGNERAGLLDPIDRISEILFGLIMAVTIVGSMSIATAHQAEVRTVMIAALGCNIAWGLVDAVMYVVRSTTESARLRELGRRIREADAVSGTAMIARDLPEHLVPIVGPAELAGIRTRLLSLPPDESRLLGFRLLLEAAPCPCARRTRLPYGAPSLLLWRWRAAPSCRRPPPRSCRRRHRALAPRRRRRRARKACAGAR